MTTFEESEIPYAARVQASNSPVDEPQVRIYLPRRRVRGLTIAFCALTAAFVFTSLTYWFGRRASLPDFLPHSAGASHDPDAHDIPMGAVFLVPAGFAAYGAFSAHTRRSWMRTREWHRRQGRI